MSEKSCTFAAVMAKRKLLGMTVAELQEVAAQTGMPRFAAKQMAQWIYQKHAMSIAEMTNLSKAARQKLEEEYEVGAMPPVKEQRSKDGTVKYLFPTEQGKTVEAVYIPDDDRATLCVSSQVGCRMGCAFCQTGKQGFDGNLTVADILNQIYALPERDTLTNIVLMGQGEPMDNYDAVIKATAILTDKDGFAWSPKRITVSSVGVKNKLARFVEESDCHVAVSLHSPFHEERLAMMPAENAMPIADTIEMLRDYNELFAHQRRLSFEYIVFDGLNDTPRHAQALVDLLKGLHCRVNLIRYHKIPGVNLKSSNEEKMLRMRDFITARGVFATIRASRGEDIYAACGMLNTKGKEQKTK